MKYTTLAEAYAAVPQAKIDTDGHATNLWHRQWEHVIAHVIPLFPKCEICEGVLHPRSPQPHHEICRLRAQSGVATPKIDNTPKCCCSPCRKTEEVQP